MFNYLMAFFQNPKKGWDPIPAKYAEQYTQWTYDNVDLAMISELEFYVNGLENKKVLDLGGGPGLYAITFAKKGANVTWLDISRNYMNIVQQAASKENVVLNYVIDYMDFAEGNFDVLFNRVCWAYCFNDTSFMKKVYDLVKPNGYGYLILHDEGLIGKYNDYGFVKKTILTFLYHLNDKTGIKVGHPVTSLKRIRKIFSKYTYKEISIEKRGRDLVYIKFQK